MGAIPTCGALHVSKRIANALIPLQGTDSFTRYPYRYPFRNMKRNLRRRRLSHSASLANSPVWKTQLNPWPTYTLALAFTLLCLSLNAQDFDSDSIYYTP